MFDQATELRKLVLRAMRENAAAAGPPPRLVALASGKGGVGVTTLAVNMSVALAEQGLRVVVVDADLYRSDVAAFCGLSDQQSIAGMAGVRRDIHEVMQLGPAGIQIVPGLWAPGANVEWNDVAQERLLRQFKTLGRHADIVMLDTGGADTEFLRRCCRLADDVVFVTTPDSVSVMDSYARIKAALSGLESIQLSLVVNHCDDARQARDVHLRVNQSCQRFLGLSVRMLGGVPHDEQVPRAAARTVPFVIGSPQSSASRAVTQIAASLSRDDRSDHGGLPRAA